MGLHDVFCITRTKRCGGEKMLWTFSSIFFLFSLSSIFIDATPVQILNVEAFNSNKLEKIENENELSSLIKIKIENVNGVQIDKLLIQPTFSSKSCDYTSEPLPIIYTNETDIVLSIGGINGHTEGYLCYRDRAESELHHMGIESKFINNR